MDRVRRFSLVMLVFGVLLVASSAIGQVRYYFKNTSAVNQQAYPDNEIYLNFQLQSHNTSPAGAAATYDIATLDVKVIQGTPNTLQGPDGNYYQDINIRLDECPVDPATGQYYIDLPDGLFGSRLYIGFGAPIYRGYGNPLLDNPGNPNYSTKIETIEFTIGSTIFTNTSRVDRYAYPIGEILYCGGALDSKVGETLTHEQVIAKWKIFVHDEFQHSYDPVRDIITQMGHTEYFQDGNPGNDYFEGFFDQLWAYASTHTMTVFFDGANHTMTAAGNTLTIGGVTFDRNLMHLEDFSGGGGQFIGNRTRMAFGVSINRGVIQLTEAVQNWEDPNGYWQQEIKNDYTNFFHSDFVSHEGQTYALAFDDVFNQSSTQACNNPDSVVVYLGGFGTEHTQVFSDVYITPLDLQVDQYKTLQLFANGLDQGMVDMEIPSDATITWTIRDPGGNPVNELIDENGLFGPTDIIGDYEVTLSVETAGGSTFTDVQTLTVNEAGTTAQVCVGPINGNMDYRLEVIGTRAYLTLVPTATWNNAAGYKRLFYGTTPDLGTMGANELTPNQPYPLDGVFFGDEVYFQIGTQHNGGSDGFIYIESLGTCEGLTVEETIVNLETDQGISIDIADTYQIPVRGITNYSNTVTHPDPLFIETIIFSGDGVDANGLFTPPGLGDYVIQISYDGILIEVTITVTTTSCTSTVNLGPFSDICQDATVTLNLPSGETYSDIVWDGNGSGYLDDLNSETPDFTGTDDGTFDLNVTATDGSGCTATGSTTITVIATPTASLPTIGPFCEGEDPVTITATVSPAGGTGVWTGATEQTETTAEFDPATEGDITLEYTYSLNGCSAIASQVVSVTAAPTASLPILSDVCAGADPINISATVSPSGGTGTFTNATKVDETTAEFDPASADDVTIDYVYSIGSCEAMASTTITVNESPTASLPTVGPFCEGEDPVTITATASPAGGTGVWAGATEQTETTAEFDPTTEGDVTVGYTYSLNGCDAIASQVVSVTAAPTASLPILSDVCAGTDPVNILATVSPSGGTGTFTNATKVDETTAEFDPASAGDVTIDYVYTIGSCGATASTTITVNESPTASLPTIGPFCEGEDPVTITATVSPAGGTGIWIGATEQTETTAEFDPATEGDITLEYTYSLNGCSAIASQVVSVTAAPTASLPILSDVCAGADPVNILATVSPSGGTGTFTNATKVNETNAEIDPASAGDVTIDYVYAIGSCEATASTTITVNESPTASLPTLGPFCEGEDPATITATVAPAGGTGVWTGATEQTETTAEFDPATEGDVTVEYTYSLNGCEATASQVVSVTAAPTASLPVLSDVCAGSDPINFLATVSPSGGTGTFTNATKVDETNAEFDPVNTGDVTIDYVYAIGSCEATASTTITVNESPTATLPTVGPFCEGEDPVTITATASPAGGTGVWTGATEQTETTAEFDPATEGDVTVEYTYSLNGCEATASQVVSVTAAPTASLPILSDVCAGTDPVNILATVSPSGGTGIFTNATKVDETTAEFDPASAEDVTIEYVYTIGSCEATASTTITVNESPTASLPTVDPFCEGEDPVTITATVAPLGGVGTWAGATEQTETSAVFTPGAVGSGSLMFTYSFEGCEVTEEAIIQIVAKPEATLLPIQTLTAGGEDVELIAEVSPNGGDGTWLNALELSETSASFTPIVEGVFTIKYVYAFAGCQSDTISTQIEVIEPKEVLIPNGLSPNNDGKNDQWEISGLSQFDDLSITIFNRWGDVVYSQFGKYNDDWGGQSNNGKDLPVGAYFYIIKSGSDASIDYSGNVSILK